LKHNLLVSSHPGSRKTGETKLRQSNSRFLDFAQLLVKLAVVLRSK
jgi:hypothetical protein